MSNNHVSVLNGQSIDIKPPQLPPDPPPKSIPKKAIRFSLPPDSLPAPSADKAGGGDKALLALPACAASALTTTVDLQHIGESGTILIKAKLNDESAVCLWDTGAEANFLSQHFVERHGLASQLKKSASSVRYADGTVKSAGGEITLPLKLLMENTTYDCSIRFTVADLQHQFDFILGMPFCRTHEPKPDWSQMTILLPDRRRGRGLAWQKCFRAQARSLRDGGVDYASKNLGEISIGALQHLRDQQQLVEWCMVTVRDPLSCNNTEADKSPRNLSPEAIAEQSRINAMRKRLLEEYKEVFPESLPAVDPKIPAAGGVVHKILLNDGAKPFSQPLRRMSTQELDELKKQLHQYLESGRIRPSDSPWGTNVIFAKKKDGGLRFCIDYRGLNDRTVKNKYALPHMEELFDRLQGARYFSKFDLFTGFYQIPMAEEDREKTAFRTRYGHFEWTVLPMGLTNAPATFQHLMNLTFREFLDQCVLVFLDDIVVYSATLEDHERDVRAVLQKLKDNHLYAKASKCELFMQEIEFLGHHVGRNGLRVMTPKVEAVDKWPVPENVTDLRSFLGLAGYYRRFVPGFSKIAAPLHELTQTKTGTPAFQWAERHQLAFDELKKKLREAPVLALPNPDLQYVVNTDASDFATGAVLQQDQGNGLQPIAYLSHKMTDAEKNYPTHDKEMLAIIKMLGEWRTYLQGRQPFTIRIRTDHNSLQYFMTQPSLTGRQGRWAEKLADFDFKIEYVKGPSNAAADACSRRPDLKVHAMALESFEKDGVVRLDKAAFLSAKGLEPIVGVNAIRRARKAMAPPAGPPQLKNQPPPPDTPEEIAQRAANIREATESHPPSDDRPAPNKRGTIVMPSQRCTGQTVKGTHCRQRTTKGQYCWNHLRSIEGLRLKRSAIAGAGMGLHAARELPKGTRILYVGDQIPLNADADGGVYFLQVSQDMSVDAARTNTAMGRWINDPRGSGQRANGRFVVHQGKACIETTRIVKIGEELLVPYGGGYWRYHGADAAARPKARAAARMNQPVKQLVKNKLISPLNLCMAATSPSSSLIELIRAAATSDTGYLAACKSPEALGYECHDSLLYHVGRIVIPHDQKLRVQLLTETHDAGSAGHTGVASTLDRLSSRVYWPGMRKEVHDYVTSCDSCQRNKVEQRRTAGLLRPPPVPNEPGYAINIDFVTGLPRSQSGHTAYMSITCRLSNMLQVGLCRDTVTAKQAAELLFDRWVIHYGLPSVIISDRDPRFMSQFWQALWKLLGTSLDMSTAGHPQTDGKAENRQRTANTMLRHYVDFEQTDWDTKLQQAVFAINHTQSASTHLTPFEVMLGRAPRLPLDAALQPLHQSDSAVGRVPAAHEFVADRYKLLWQHAQANLLKAQADQKRFADKHRREESFVVGDQVLLSTRDLAFINPEDIKRSAKFTARFVGPFPVKRVINENAYELDLPPELKIHPTQNVSKLRRYRRSDPRFDGRPQPIDRPPPQMVDPAGNASFEVERILAHRRLGRGRGREEYLIKWKGFPNEDSSWVAKSNMDSPDLLAEFHSLQETHRDAES